VNVVKFLEQNWKSLEPIFSHKTRKNQRGRKPCEAKKILLGILFVLVEGIKWRSLQELKHDLPSYQTCHRWFQRWQKEGKFKFLFQKITEQLLKKRHYKRLTVAMDGTFIRGKKGGFGIGKTKCGKGSKLMVLNTTTGIFLGAYVSSASKYESHLVASLFSHSVTKRIKTVLADRGYDDFKLFKWLKKKRILLIAPHKKNRVHCYQDRRSLRQYWKRYIVEQGNSHLQNFKRVLIRYERKIENYQAFVHFSMAILNLNKF
jgi:transposase